MRYVRGDCSQEQTNAPCRDAIHYMKHQPTNTNTHTHTQTHTEYMTQLVSSIQ